MSYEDVIRVAQAKIDPARFDRIARELGVKPEQTFTVTEFLKPGIDEFCSVLPPWLARPHSRLGERHPAFGRAHWGMAVNTASVSGYLRFFARQAAPLPAQNLPLPGGAARDRGLACAHRAGAPLSAELAIEIAECARLIKGYGDTHKRGSGNYRLIEEQLIAPALAGNMPARQAVDAIASARAAALLDPEGEALAKCLADSWRAGPCHRRRIGMFPREREEPITGSCNENVIARVSSWQNVRSKIVAAQDRADQTGAA